MCIPVGRRLRRGEGLARSAGADDKRCVKALKRDWHETLGLILLSSRGIWALVAPSLSVSRSNGLSHLRKPVGFGSDVLQQFEADLTGEFVKIRGILGPNSPGFIIKSPKKVVRIAGLEPAFLAALPPQSSVSANSTICAQPGHTFCLIAAVVQVIFGRHLVRPIVSVA